MDAPRKSEPTHIADALPQPVPCDRCDGMTWRPDDDQPHPWLCAYCKEADDHG